MLGGDTDGKASIERLCLSPYVEKPFNSKIIKKFVPELRSCKCFSCFGIPMFYVYILRTFYVRFTYPYIFMYGYVTIFLRFSALEISSLVTLRSLHGLVYYWYRCHLHIFSTFSSLWIVLNIYIVFRFLIRISIPGQQKGKSTWKQVLFILLSITRSAFLVAIEGFVLISKYQKNL